MFLKIRNKALRKMGTKGKTIAAILAGGAGLLAGSTMMGDKKVFSS
jgi:chemotaxis receptor (MCP) glutamine deamidase CheD